MIEFKKGVFDESTAEVLAIPRTGMVRRAADGWPERLTQAMALKTARQSSTGSVTIVHEYIDSSGVFITFKMLVQRIIRRFKN